MSIRECQIPRMLHLPSSIGSFFSIPVFKLMRKEQG